MALLVNALRNVLNVLPPQPPDYRVDPLRGFLAYLYLEIANHEQGRPVLTSLPSA